MNELIKIGLGLPDAEKYAEGVRYRVRGQAAPSESLRHLESQSPWRHEEFETFDFERRTLIIDQALPLWFIPDFSLLVLLYISPRHRRAWSSNDRGRTFTLIHPTCECDSCRLRRGERPRGTMIRREVQNERGEIVTRIEVPTTFMDRLNRAARSREYPPEINYKGPEAARQWAKDFWTDKLRTWESKENNRKWMDSDRDPPAAYNHLINAMVSDNRSEREARAREIRGFGQKQTKGTKAKAPKTLPD